MSWKNGSGKGIGRDKRRKAWIKEGKVGPSGTDFTL